MNRDAARLVVFGMVALAIGLAALPGRPLLGLAGAAIAVALALGIERLVARAPITHVIWGTAGTVTGLVAGFMVGRAAYAAAGESTLGSTAFGLAVAVGGYVGGTIGARRASDMIGLNALLFPAPRDPRPMKLLDTSAIIDGRIADLAATGFVEGPLVVPGFVLRELQRIADSADSRKRARGKRGFEIVQRLQRLPGGLVQVQEIDVPGVEDVDRKLVELAKDRGAKVVTTDYNLNQLADVNGVAVLNVNEVANAVKFALVAGEAMKVHVMREGKEPGQGLAYLDDGTMVVVEQGKRWIGRTVDVVVTTVLQTPSGRIVFTRPRGEDAARA